MYKQMNTICKPKHIQEWKQNTGFPWIYMQQVTEYDAANISGTQLR